MDSMSRPLEITVLSGEDLRIDGRPLNKNAYVVVRMDANNIYTTRMVEECGGYPMWDEKAVVDMPNHVNSVGIEVLCKRAARIRSVGAVRIPVSEFVGGYAPENHLHFLSYRLRGYDGTKNGIVNFSVRVKVPEHLCFNPKSRLPAAENSAVVGENSSGRVVTGLPIW